MTVPITVSEAARLLHMTPSGVREWERRAQLPSMRTRGGHRRYDRRVILGLVDARDEGARGAEAVARAVQLAASGRYNDPGPLRERMDRLEARLREMQTVLEALVVHLDRQALDA